ncbi:MAG: MotA/TolQ/ExbB proton channel family protein [Patescibacteria group bacterium]
MSRKRPLALLHKKDPERYHFLLWFKFVILNILFGAFMVIAFFQGWVDIVFAKTPNVGCAMAFLTFDSQTSYIFLMAGVFLAGWLISLHRVYVTSREINYLKLQYPPEFSRVSEYLAHIKGANEGSRAFLFERLSEKLFSRIDIVRYVSVVLPLLGLLGTVLGFAIVSSGIEPNAVSDANAAAKMVTALGKGLGVALYTTIVGGVLGGLWLGGIYQVLRVGSGDFLNLLGERGEREVNMKKDGVDSDVPNPV